MTPPGTPTRPVPVVGRPQVRARRIVGRSRVRPRPRRRRGGRRDDRGSGVVELPVMAVFFFGPLLALAIFVGRMHAGYTAVESAARQAARTVSIARDPAAAAGVAEADAAATVREGSARCRDMGFTHTVTTEEVTVTISCTVDLSEASLVPVIPGVRSVSATAIEPRDRHRETAP